MRTPPLSQQLTRHSRLIRTAAFAFLGLVLILGQLLAPSPVQAASSSIVISQVYGGGGNSGATFKNDFIELYNRGGVAVDVSTWSVQYASSAGTFSASLKTNLVGIIQPGHYYLVQEAAGSGGTLPLPTPDTTGSIAMSATGAKVALVSSQTSLTCGGVAGNCFPNASIVDFVGYDGANNFEGAPTPILSNTTAALRALNGCTDTDNNAADFSVGAPNPRNSASPVTVCAGPTNPGGTGTAVPGSLIAGNSTLLKVTVTPGTNPTSTGITVTANLLSIGGSAAQALSDDGTNGDVAAGDLIFSFQATVASNITPGSKTLPVAISDAQLRSGSTSITLTVEPPQTAIHDLQGSGLTSPHVGELVATRGIVTGVKSNGFFIQMPDSLVDGDPNTSEGIFIFTSSNPSSLVSVGDDVKVTGTIQEFIPASDPVSPPATEIAGSPAFTVLSSGNPLPAPVTLTSADTTPTGGLEQLERFEGMRVHVDSLVVVAPTGGSINEANATSTSSGIFYGVIDGVARPFTEPGIVVPDLLPVGSPCCVPRFDGNPEKLRVDSDGLLGATRLEATTGAIIPDVTGPLDFASRSYTILPDPGSLTQASVSGNISAIPVPDACPAEFTVASSNMERFYDTINDPSTSDAILTAAAFDKRLNKVSLAIRNVMKFPDIIGVEELENLPTLQTLADRVNSDAVAAGQPNPQYQAFLEEGNDVGGIDVGFLVKTPRVTVIDVTQVGKDATYTDPITDPPSQALMNDRPPLLMHATIQPPAGAAFPVTVIVNHLRSLSGIDDPVDGIRIRAKRAAQAEFLAQLIQDHQAAGEHVISVGDYNSTQFNDGYVDVIGTVKGTPVPFDEVVVATNALVNPTLTDLVDLAPASERYSFVFDGNAQDLDHILVTANLLSRVNGVFYARTNADFPESFRGDGTRPERFSDHDIPVGFFQLPAILTGASVDQPALWPPNHKLVPITVNYTLQNVCTTDPVNVTLSVISNEPINGTGDGDTDPDWVVIDPHHVMLRAERAGTGNGRVYTITITATDSKGNVTTQAVTVTVALNKS
ncbi:MAG: lamin tail domain-containing protein [Acidobacteriia bacterium]|nr:lamin tail domain-containing protein [Terriglobia bacterium]